MDRQILAIARVNRADALITEDVGLLKLAAACKMKTMQINELELPDAARQHTLDLKEEDE